MLFTVKKEIQTCISRTSDHKSNFDTAVVVVSVSQLQMITVWKGLKFVIWQRVKVLKCPYPSF